MVVTGTGTSVPQAQQAAYARVRQVKVPNMRYRNDIGDKLVREDLMTLEKLGYVSASPDVQLGYFAASPGVQLHRPKGAR